MKKYVLPLITVLMLILSGFALITSVRDNSSEKSGSVQLAEKDAQGNVVIYSKELSETNVTFFRLGGDSKVEFLARRGADGFPKVALGTCQACYGSPEAYYVQDGNALRCMNCGQTFSLRVLDTPGIGCRPISLGDAFLQTPTEKAVIRADAIPALEKLFANVAQHGT